MSCVGKRNETDIKVVKARQRDMETETYRETQKGAGER